MVRLGHLRAGVPCVHVQGRLDHATASGVQQVVLGLLAAAPWAVVLDLRALTGLTPDAVPALVELACHAGEADIGLYLVTAAPWWSRPSPPWVCARCSISIPPPTARCRP
jgi:anti-sigma B factor antagonist